MAAIIPGYSPPDFSQPEFNAAAPVQTVAAATDGVVPNNYHGTSNYPEYLRPSCIRSLSATWCRATG